MLKTKWLLEQPQNRREQGQRTRARVIAPNRLAATWAQRKIRPGRGQCSTRSCAARGVYSSSFSSSSSLSAFFLSSAFFSFPGSVVRR